MTINKSLGILLILISLLLVSMSFGHEYVNELITASTLTITPSAMEVTPGSTVVLNYEFTSSWGTRLWNFNLEGGGYDSWSPKVTLNYGEPYYNSFSVTAPSSPGIVTYEIKPYFYVFYQGKDRVVGNPSQKVTITVAEPEVFEYDLTVIVIDSNSNPLPDAEVLINTGVIGVSDSSGTVIKQDLSGSYTVTATKEGYHSDSASVSMTADKTVTLQLISTTEPTPEPTGEPGETPTPIATLPNGEPISITPVPTPVKYKFVVEMLDNSDPQEPIPDVKIMINGRTHYSDAEGKVTYVSDPGEALSIVITKDGYNTFKKSYVITSNTVVKITLAPSGGDFFLDLDLKEDNPFYDPEGLFNVMPTWVAVSAALFFITGTFLLMKKKETRIIKK
ncbi:carboxypeptidase regulatory-like domain-containing protein [Candidatus Dependentiae bacterium]|nr:carboxypeptidase regulatory-like domain-containing protein [Candidatus Dependentiae bacterium]